MQNGSAKFSYISKLWKIKKIVLNPAVCFEKLFSDEATTKAVKFMIPVVGSAVAAAMSGTSTYGLLKTTLNSSRILAEKCLEVLKNYFHTVQE